MKKLNIGLAYDKIGIAVKNALGTSDKLNSQTHDEQLTMYNNLTVQDFGNLRTKFGDTAVLTYIKNMEAKKMRTNG